ncbi:hypothetical protein [Bordetella trematum]|uniref:hypothetical protein n=1 Tax=Bordetella trematum TaxID=123899 RepID=UPI0013FE272D|nr:hypothetical protein [Bordetella trematum]
MRSLMMVLGKEKSQETLAACRDAEMIGEGDGNVYPLGHWSYQFVQCGVRRIPAVLVIFQGIEYPISFFPEPATSWSYQWMQS